MEKVILYTIHCPACKLLEDLLTEKHIPFEICTDKELMAKKGFTQMPMLQVGEEIMNYRKAWVWASQR